MIVEFSCLNSSGKKFGEPEGVHRQLEGCNRNLQPPAAVAKVYTHEKLVGSVIVNSYDLVELINLIMYFVHLLIDVCFMFSPTLNCVLKFD